MPQAMQDMFGAEGMVGGYVAFLGSFVAVLTAAYVVYALHSLLDEERRGRADLVLATPVSRASWAGAHLAVVASGAVLILLVTGVFTALAAAGVTGDASLVGGVIGAHLVANFADLLDLPGWLRALSPLHHLAAVPVEEFVIAPSLLLTALAGFLVAAGLVGFRRRQVAAA